MGQVDVAEPAECTTLGALEKSLLNAFQHDFPLVPKPFATVAARIGARESEVLATLSRLQAQGTVSRVGPVFRPHRVGTSTLAAMAVPPEQLSGVATLVNAYPEVNHNYEREHHFNLWFVVTAADEAQLNAVLVDIGERAGLPVMSLPMLEAYHLDLGFRLDPPGVNEGAAVRRATPSSPQVELVRRPLSIRDEADRRLVAAVQGGLALTERPYAAVAHAAQLAEKQVLRRLGEWLQDGTIGRHGIVVRHRELGYRANAMVVWDIPDEEVREVGNRFRQFDFVTLCYRRPRRLPHWPYNLFCMIHGQDRAAVEQRVQLLATECGLSHVERAVLFSLRRFKQRGARYVNAVEREVEFVVAGGGHG